MKETINMNKKEKDVWDTILEMNRKWTVENKAEDLKNYFHKNMVAITPVDLNRVEGQENCVKGWVNFAKNSKITSWKERDPKVQIYNESFAIVTYYFDMSFDVGSQTINMKGRDMFALVKEKGKWLVVADQFSQFPSL